MKLTGLAVLCMAFGLSGIYIASRRKRKAEILDSLSAFFTELSGTVSLFGCDTVRAVEKICLTRRFSSLSFLKTLLGSYSCGCNFKELWRNAVYGGDDTALLSDEQREVLASFAEGLGRSSLDCFSSRCAEFSSVFAVFARRETARNRRTQTLIVYSGFLAGAALLIAAI